MPIQREQKEKPKKMTKKALNPPAGYTSVTPYLIVSDADAAINFYKKAFMAIEIMRIPGENSKVSHAELEIAGSRIMLADSHPALNAMSPEEIGGTPVSLHLYIDDVDNVVERAVSLGAVLMRDVETMFYGDRSGSIKDPFGHQWFISTHVEEVSPDEMKKRMKALKNSVEN